MPYFDTSVIAAYYCPEELSDTAERVLRYTPVPVISPLVEVELASAVARKVREKVLDRVDAARILAEFRGHLSQGLYGIAQITPVHYAMAAAWIGTLETPLRALDAIHLAVAAENNEQVVTSDRVMAAAARHLKVPCRLLDSRRSPS